MNRSGLIIALAVAAVTGLVFGLYPQLDLAIARHFHDYIDISRNAFAWRISPPLMLARNLGLWVGTILIAPSVAALIVKLVVPQWKMFISGRAIVFLIATLVLEPTLYFGDTQPPTRSSPPVDRPSARLPRLGTSMKARVCARSNTPGLQWQQLRRP